MKLLRGSLDPDLRRVRVAWTCDADPASQPVDIPILHATFDAEAAERARERGKEVWVYNGERPFSGTFLLDAEAVSPRVNGWLGAVFGVGRWFYWESTFWYDDNKGGHGAVDPFVTAETFHNADGDHADGDGVLVYPGRQVDLFQEHSAGVAGVFPSIRLKNWRRGVEDAGYYQLAHLRSPARAEAIARRLLPRVASAAKEGEGASWSSRGAAFFEARRELLAVI